MKTSLRFVAFSVFTLSALTAGIASAQPAPMTPPSPTPNSGAPRPPTAPLLPPAPSTAPSSPSPFTPPPAGPQLGPPPSTSMQGGPNFSAQHGPAPLPADAIKNQPLPRHEESLPMLEPGARVMTLDEVINVAQSRNVEARTADVEIQGTEATRMGSFGEVLPKVHLDASLQEWDRPFNLAFGSLGNFSVRDQFTWTFGATLIQPITGLWSGISKTSADKLGIDIAKIQKESTRRDVGFRAAEGYLRLLESKRLVEVAQASVTTLEAQAKQAHSLFTNGVIAKNDLLRAELAVSNAKQREIQARGNVTLGRGRLGILLGLPATDKIDVAPLPLTADPSQTQEVAVENAEQQAQQRRLEVTVFQKKIEQADQHVSQAKGQLLPQINGAANYTHYAGSAFQQADAAYIGLVGSWDIWDWGTTYARTKQAIAQKDEAELARERIEEQVRTEARQAAVDATTAREALGVARTALQQAEENYRIVSLRYEQAQSTTFDVVDAESLLTQARAQVETATYSWLVAQLGLQRAIGESTPKVR